MGAQTTVVYILLLLHYAAAKDVVSEESLIKNLVNPRRYKKNDLTTYDRKPPIQYLNTPNFDVMLLSEENSDPTWRKYSELFPPKDIRNAHQIEVNYGSHDATIGDNFRRPTIRLERSEVESVLASLGSKKHIIVLHPRNCKPHFTRRGVKDSSLDEFENEFLPKLLQQLNKRTSTQQIGSDMVDPVIDRILTLLDKDEQKMLDDLRKTFEGFPQQVQYQEESPIYSSGYTTSRRKPNAYNRYGSVRTRIPTKVEPRAPQLKDVLYQDPCNEGYVFLVQNQKNSIDPRSLNDLLMRVLKVVTQSG